METTSYFLPAHLSIPIIISLSLLLLILSLRKPFFKSRKWLFISFTVFLCVYIFILVSAIYLSNHYKWELEKFDLDGNGIFSNGEITPDLKHALAKVSNDTARNFSFITGLIYAFTISTITYITGRIIEFIRGKKALK